MDSKSPSQGSGQVMDVQAPKTPSGPSPIPASGTNDDIREITADPTSNQAASPSPADDASSPSSEPANLSGLESNPAAVEPVEPATEPSRPEPVPPPAGGPDDPPDEPAPEPVQAPAVNSVELASAVSGIEAVTANPPVAAEPAVSEVEPTPAVSGVDPSPAGGSAVSAVESALANPGSSDDTPSVSQPGPNPLAIHNTGGSRKPMLVVIAAIVIALGIGVSVVMVYMRNHKSKSNAKTSTTAQNASGSTITTKPATVQDVDKVVTDTDKSLSEENDAKDFSATDVSDTSLGL